MPRVEYPRTTPLVPGRLVRRYKRFFVDVELADGRVVTAHCANTGAMEGLTRPGLAVWISAATNPARTLAWTWELVESDGRIYGAHTATPNQLVRRLLAEGRLEWLGRYDEWAAERVYGERSRVDFWLRRGRRQTFVEVKNCHLVYPDGRAYFPDAVSERATKHLHELAREVAAGHRAEVLFVCQTGPVKSLRPSDHHDPTFAAAARETKAAGVRFSAIVVGHRVDAIEVLGRVPVDLKPYETGRVEKWRTTAKPEP
jgi:sugar fermentation stimulation protein A